MKILKISIFLFIKKNAMLLPRVRFEVKTEVLLKLQYIDNAYYLKSMSPIIYVCILKWYISIIKS